MPTLNVAITDVGISESIRVMESGMRVSITDFKLGSGVAYTPTTADTDLHGTEVYTAPITEVIQTGPTELTFKVVISEHEGPFDFGEIGLYTETDVLFALISLDTTYSKGVTSGTQQGDVFRLSVPVTINNGIDNIVITHNTVSSAEFDEVATINALPEASIAPVNAYLVANAPYTRRTIAIRGSSDDYWHFTDYSPLPSGVVTASAAGTVTFTFNGNLPSLTEEGDYILQGTSTATTAQAVTGLTITQVSSTVYTMTYDTSVVGFQVGSEVQLWMHDSVLNGLMYQYYAAKDWIADSWSRHNFVMHEGALYLAVSSTITAADVPGVSAKWLPIMDFTSPVAASRLTGLIADARIPDNIVRTTRAVNTTGLLTGGGSLASDLTLAVQVATLAEAQAGTVTNRAMTPESTRQSVEYRMALRSVNTTGLLTGGGNLGGDLTLNVAAASQIEAETGTDNSKVMTPLRSRQGVNKRLSELQLTTQGLAVGGGTLDASRDINVPISSQAQAEAGVDNTTAITPLRLRQGVLAMLGATGVSTSGLATGGGSSEAGVIGVHVPKATTLEAIAATLDTVAMTPKTTGEYAEARLARIVHESTDLTITGSLSTDRVTFALKGVVKSIAEQAGTGVLVKTGAGTATTRRIKPGAGISVKTAAGLDHDSGATDDFYVAVDGTVVRTSGEQSIGGKKTFTTAVDIAGSAQNNGLAVYRPSQTSQKVIHYSNEDGNFIHSKSITGVSNKPLTVRVSNLSESSEDFIFGTGGFLTAKGFIGDGGNLTGLHAPNINTGKLDPARLTFATQAEAEAESGWSSGAVMSPLRTRQQILSMFEAQKQTAGYTRLANGVIIQWTGRVNVPIGAGQNGQLITFPIAFPNRVGALSVFDWIGEGEVGNFHQIGGYDVLPTGCRIVVRDAENQTWGSSWIYVMAIGY